MVVRSPSTMIIAEKDRAASLGTSPLYFFWFCMRRVDMYDKRDELWELVNKILDNEY